MPGLLLTKLTSRNAAIAAAAVVSVFLSASAFAFDPAAGDFSKVRPDSIRVLSWNVFDQFINNTDKDPQFKRVIEAISPDIIAFQEISGSMGTETQIRNIIINRLQTYEPQQTWHVYVSGGSGNKNVLCSRYPMSMNRRDTIPSSDIRGVNIGLIDLPDATFNRDLYVMNVHFKCCNDSINDHRRRQVHADALTNWMRDAREPGGNVNIPTGTPMLAVGDFNLINAGDQLPYHARRTMLDGTIYHTETYGQSSPPDWDGSNNADVAPYDHTNANPSTHPSGDPRSRIDRFYYTDSVMHSVAGFVLNSQTMTPAARNTAGLLANDTRVADHMPIVADFALGPDPNPPGELRINEYMANDIGVDDRTFLELKNIGGREINLDAPRDYWLKQAQLLPDSPPGWSNQQAARDLTGVVPPGGFFVLYDGAGESAFYVAIIKARLPAVQRQDIDTFFLDNDNNSAFALVDRANFNLTSNIEFAIEAYGYAAPSPTTTRYFRTASGNNLQIALGPDQWTNFNANGSGSDLSISRNPGDQTLNSYAHWSIPATPTPGVENVGPAGIGSWMLY